MPFASVTQFLFALLDARRASAAACRSSRVSLRSRSWCSARVHAATGSGLIGEAARAAGRVAAERCRAMSGMPGLVASFGRLVRPCSIGFDAAAGNDRLDDDVLLASVTDDPDEEEAEPGDRKGESDRGMARRTTGSVRDFKVSVVYLPGSLPVCEESLQATYSLACRRAELRSARERGATYRDSEIILDSQPRQKWNVQREQRIA